MESVGDGEKDDMEKMLDRLVDTAFMAGKEESMKVFREKKAAA